MARMFWWLNRSFLGLFCTRSAGLFSVFSGSSLCIFFVYPSYSFIKMITAPLHVNTTRVVPVGYMYVNTVCRNFPLDVGCQCRYILYTPLHINNRSLLFGLQSRSLLFGRSLLFLVFVCLVTWSILLLLVGMCFFFLEAAPTCVNVNILKCVWGCVLFRWVLIVWVGVVCWGCEAISVSRNARAICGIQIAGTRA